MTHFSTLPPEDLIIPEGYACDCGRTHSAAIKYLDIAPGAVKNVCRMLKAVGCRHPMVICGPNGYEAAGKRVEAFLRDGGIEFSTLVIPEPHGDKISPAEEASGSILLNFDRHCDGILAVGSGVINDLCKCAAVMSGRPCMVVGTAPSMDGYASDNASMEVNHVKLSLMETCPSGIICDAEIMAKAPMKLLQAGLGDMLAKYTALCEWKITNIVNGEYYCPEVAELMNCTLRNIVAGASGIKNRSVDSVNEIARGLVVSGLAIAYAGCSRPASGLDHYFSHAWEMIALAEGRPYELHGIQVGIGTLLALRVYQYILSMPRPTMERVEAAADSFDEAAWEANIRRVFKNTADDILAMELKAQKNERSGRMKRAKAIIDNWDQICDIIRSDLPSYESVHSLMADAGMPLKPQDIGLSAETAIDAFICSRDIRNKYLISSLLWDVGYLNDCAAWLRAQEDLR